MRKGTRWVLALLLFLPLLAIPSASAHDIWGWIRSDDPGLVLTQSSRAEREHPNECEGSGFAARFNGTDPDWVRVGGSPNPATAFVEATGQVLLDPPGGSTGSNNPRITPRRQRIEPLEPGLQRLAHARPRGSRPAGDGQHAR